MQTRAKTFGIISTCGLLLALAATAAIYVPHPALAQQSTGNL